MNSLRALATEVSRKADTEGTQISVAEVSRTVATNVHEVIYFVQRNPVVSIGREGGWIQPAGHSVVPVSKQKTKVWPPKILSQDHSNMDDSREYHQALLEACNG